MVAFDDLVRAGLLDEGDVLVMVDQNGVEHVAVVRVEEQSTISRGSELFQTGQMSFDDTEQVVKVGQIETLDGRRFGSASEAARHVSASEVMGGGQTWRTLIDGVALTDLEWRLRARLDLQEHERVALSKWIRFRLQRGEDPAERDEQTLNDCLSSQTLTPADVTAHRSLMHYWFRRCGSDHDNSSPLKDRLDGVHNLGPSMQ